MLHGRHICYSGLEKKRERGLMAHRGDRRVKAITSKAMIWSLVSSCLEQYNEVSLGRAVRSGN
jgi:hypothetical protein